MSGGAVSFEVRSERPEKVVQLALSRAERVGKSGAGVLFVARDLVEHVPQIASALAAYGSDFTWIVASALGVLTERGELEGQSAAAGLVTGGARAKAIVMGPHAGSFGAELGDALTKMPSSSALVLLRADKFDGEALEDLTRNRRPGVGERVFGGGTLGQRDVYVVEQGKVSHGAGAALVVAGLGQARVAASPACKLLSPLLRVTKVRGSMLVELEGQRALDALSASAEDLDDQPLILVAIAAPSSQESATERPELLVRAIQGVDPARGGIVIGEAVEVGTRVAFAIRDAHTARSDFESHLRKLANSSAGAAPRFGIFVSCAGRGSNLYGAPDVDVKLVRSRFAEMPFVGLSSAFEIAPFADSVALQLYTGVLAVFTAPS